LEYRAINRIVQHWQVKAEIDATEASATAERPSAISAKPTATDADMWPAAARQPMARKLAPLTIDQASRCEKAKG
jgi:hypothetical protein